MNGASDIMLYVIQISFKFICKVSSVRGVYDTYLIQKYITNTSIIISTG